ncbi:MAG TPA: bifunctional hydroxymethylpyrimidine kinase/phosphomethylpyrimidine kinase [Candidatus Methylacidiphilales bacterium]|jgi:hydroxymethylpyrimidine/phosphomethylpyrimidine kinase|nr:bifunctional hydroxymethylpyrimidine kinase/phosphomethylpyrimidine kinase [Candidatus Methylacidiphilales bacterium]
MIRSQRQSETSSSSPLKDHTAPVVLTIAGSDNSGGAGLQADLKTFTTLGVYGTTAVTCIVAEHPGRVLNITPVPPARVADQIRLVLEAFPVAAIKTGMLYSAEIVAAVGKAIMPALARGVPLVVDPVMVASSGKVLMKKDAIRALRKLITLSTVVTPNRDEAALLWDEPITSLQTLSEAALGLAQGFHGPAILAKGGHLREQLAVDVLAYPDGRVHEFAAPRIPGVDPHGTGCTYSAAIAAGLAKSLTLTEAVTLGKAFITWTLRRRFQIGPYQLLNHLPG